MGCTWLLNLKDEMCLYLVVSRFVVPSIVTASSLSFLELELLAIIHLLVDQSLKLIVESV